MALGKDMHKKEQIKRLDGACRFALGWGRTGIKRPLSATIPVLICYNGKLASCIHCPTSPTPRTTQLLPTNLALTQPVGQFWLIVVKNTKIHGFIAY
jgi:hypothetical protein